MCSSKHNLFTIHPVTRICLLHNCHLLVGGGEGLVPSTFGSMAQGVLGWCQPTGGWCQVPRWLAMEPGVLELVLACWCVGIFSDMTGCGIWWGLVAGAAPYVGGVGA